MSPTLDVLIIGAGWSGISAAEQITQSGLRCQVVEKGRGPGGRCATRRHNDWRFDHGAQYFTARTQEFDQALRDWEKQGLVSRWDPEIKVVGQRPSALDSNQKQQMTRWVGVGGNNSVLRHMSEPLNVHYQTRVEALCRDQGIWFVTMSSAQGERIVTASTIILTAPPSQSAELVGPNHSLYETLSSHRMHSAWAVLIAFDAPVILDYDAAFINEGPLSWVCRQSAKPGHAGEAWVLHASPDWSDQHIDAPAETIGPQLYQAWLEVSQGLPPSPSYRQAHRWRFAQSVSPLDVGYLHDSESDLWVAGDWCRGDRVEGAWLSGRAAAKALTS